MINLKEMKQIPKNDIDLFLEYLEIVSKKLLEYQEL